MSSSRRERLLDAAAATFARYGYKRAAVDDIARAAGVAKGSIYLEFPSKKAVFVAVAERLATQLVDAAASAAGSAGSPVERVTAALMAKFWTLYELVHTSAHASELIDSKNALCAPVFAAADGRYAAILQGLLAELAASGAWMPEPPHSVESAVALLLRGAHGACYGAGAPLDERAYRGRLRAAAAVVLSGTATAMYK